MQWIVAGPKRNNKSQEMSENRNFRENRLCPRLVVQRQSWAPSAQVAVSLRCHIARFALSDNHGNRDGNLAAIRCGAFNMFTVVTMNSNDHMFRWSLQG